MMTRSKTILVVALALLGGALLGGGGLYLFLRPDVKAARGPEAIRLCDELGADGRDPTAVTNGIDAEQLDADDVIAVCSAAVASEPDTMRFKFQLARGFLANSQVDEGVDQLVEAAEAGHAASIAYLADIYLDGAPGIEADPDLAMTLYHRAAEAGFAAAEDLVGEFKVTSEDEAFDPEELEREARKVRLVKSMYNHPKVVENILNGDLDRVPYGELYTKSFLLSMAENISVACEGQHFNRRSVEELKNSAAMNLIEVSPEAGFNNVMGQLMGLANLMRNPNASIQRMAQADTDATLMPEEAMKDAFSLVGEFECGSAQLDDFSENLKAYVTDAGAPRMSTGELSNRCMNESRPTGRYNAQNFCMCFTGAMTQTAISRGIRKRLQTAFWETAQDMIERDRGTFGACIDGIQ